MDIRAIVRAFLEEKLGAENVTEEMINFYLAHIDFEEATLPEDQQDRTVTITQDSSGKYKAESYKLLNIKQVSMDDLISSLGKLGVLTFVENNYAKALSGLFLLVLDFRPKLRIKLDEQDANVIFAIAKLEKKEFSVEEVATSYQVIFGETLDVKRLNASLNVLVDLNTIKRLSAIDFKRIRKIKNLVRD